MSADSGWLCVLDSFILLISSYRTSDLCLPICDSLRNLPPVFFRVLHIGLTADELDSFHGTGTAANDDNESDVVNQQRK